MKKILLKIYYAFIKIINRFAKIGPTPYIYSVSDSIDLIKTQKKSVSRYGDGELWCLLGGEIRYQSKNSELKNRLKEILKSENENIYICLPDVFSGKRLKLRTNENQQFWRNHLTEHRLDWYKNINWNRKYLNTAVSRFWIPFQDKEQSRKNSIELKKIWEGKDILLIEGEKSRLGVGNDLFDVANSIKRILAPAENAYNLYDEIFRMAKKYGNKKLILIALGPTATVLAYDLALIGYWAIDIGHVDLEYEWMKNGALQQEKVKGKYVNEVIDGNQVESEFYGKKEYEEQIICKIVMRNEKKNDSNCGSSI